MSGLDYLNPDRINFTPVSQANPLPVAIMPGTAVYIPATATVVAAGTGYAPEDEITVSGSNSVSPTVLEVATTQVMTAAVVAGGTGGTPGAVTITGTTGTGTPFQATGTITAGGVLSGALVVTVPGSYSANPTDIAAEPVTGGSLTGTTVILTMGVLTATVTTPGATSTSSASVAQTATDGAGTGATFTLAGSEQPSLAALIGSPDDAVGANTVIGLLKQIAENTEA